MSGRPASSTVAFAPPSRVAAPPARTAPRGATFEGVGRCSRVHAASLARTDLGGGVGRGRLGARGRLAPSCRRAGGRYGRGSPAASGGAGAARRCAWACAGGRRGLGRGCAGLGQLGDGRLRGALGRYGRCRRRFAGHAAAWPASLGRASLPRARWGSGRLFASRPEGWFPPAQTRSSASRTRINSNVVVPATTERARSRSASRWSQAATSAARERTSARATPCLKAGAVLGSAELGVWRRSGSASRSARGVRPSRSSARATSSSRLPSRCAPAACATRTRYTLPALARLAGAEVVSVERCQDDPEATRAAMERATRADVAVFCGGVSVGVHDHVKDAFAAVGIEERFWGVALRPGKPTWFGTPRRRPRLRASGQPRLGGRHVHPLRPARASRASGSFAGSRCGRGDACRRCPADGAPRSGGALRAGRHRSGLARDADRAAGLARPHLDAGRRRSHGGRGRHRPSARLEALSGQSSCAYPRGSNEQL